MADYQNDQDLHYRGNATAEAVNDGVNENAPGAHANNEYVDEKYQYNDVKDVEGDEEQIEEDEEDSPIEEVRAVVSNKDDPTLPVMTFRFWLLGITFTGVFAFINQFFWFRSNPLTLTPLVCQIVTYPLGKALEKALPRSRFFNPGPFNMKEHVLIVAMVNSCYLTAYAIDIIVIQQIFYKQPLGFGGGILLVLTTQFIGYGMAGFARPYLVYPSAMVWPSDLVNIALFRSFHDQKFANAQDGVKGPTRYKFFVIAMTCQFVYYWLPGYFFSVLSTFSWMCWINPNNIVLAQMTGYFGLGMGIPTFDWNAITSWLFSPLVVPWWAIANIGVGFVLLAWVLVPILYYSNVWNAKEFPIISSGLFTTTGQRYPVLDVLTPDLILNETAYEEVGPLRITAFFAITYGVGFAGLAAVLVHTYLYHGKEIWAQWKASRHENEDIHRKLMREYPEVPTWWYAIIFVVAFSLSFVVVYVWPIHLPWWGLFLSIGLSAIFLIPIGIIQALTNQQPGLNVITEFIIGFAYPGHPIANVTFKTYGYISMTQALSFCQDLKLGHYAKVPPRSMFIAQCAGTFIACFVNLGTAQWLMSRDGVCTTDANYSCPSASVFYSASVIWGVIGPARQFGNGSPYQPVLWFFLIGAVLPIPFYFLSKRFPNSWVKYIHIPLIFNATGIMPPALPINFSMWIFVGFIFMYWMRKYRHAWWQKYNYILSASQDSGLAFGILITSICLFFAPWYPVWWGSDALNLVDHCDNAYVSYNAFYAAQAAGP
ncbi:hypothetical protein BZG36_00095 [Bifiguratus adelaidae]|uniref:OPT family small oligopeptide transporter n=1 Tax=Bifiguratus adelaidae TaxID=1938954 RepID=A0A261Y921_9FUNG|nr:hypothetical protein BZG36_00095 [Bifiguratus adelaidae]